MAINLLINGTFPKMATLSACAFARSVVVLSAPALAAWSKPGVDPGGLSRLDPGHPGGERGHVLLRLEDGVAPDAGAAPVPYDWAPAGTPPAEPAQMIAGEN
jgi:hypothetical protein